jgi:hypothetical protein
LVRVLPLFGISRGVVAGLRQMQHRIAEATKGDESKPATYTNEILALSREGRLLLGSEVALAGPNL